MKSRAVLCLLLLGACASCNKKAEGQTVAVVGGDEITVSELNSELAGANLPAGADKKQATARILQNIVDRRLLAQEARKEGIDRSPEFISRERKANEELLISMLASRQMDSNKLPTQAQINAFEAQHPQAFSQREIWQLSQLQYDTPTDPTVLAKIGQTKTIDDLAAVLTAAHIPFRRSSNQLLSSSIPSEIYPKLVSLAPGEPFVVPNGDKSVASVVTAKQPAPLDEVRARTMAVEMMRRGDATKVLEQRLKGLRASTKIEYKPGFGAPKSQ